MATIAEEILELKANIALYENERARTSDTAQRDQLLRVIVEVRKQVTILMQSAEVQVAEPSDILTSIITNVFVLVAIAAGMCATISSAKSTGTPKISRDFNTAGLALTTVIAITPLVLTNIIRVCLGFAQRHAFEKSTWVIVFYVAVVSLIIYSAINSSE